VILRAPGCVWSSPPTPAGFISIDLAGAQLPQGTRYGAMTWRPADRLPSMPALVECLMSAESLLARQQLTASLVDALFAAGFAHDGEPASGEPPAARRARDYLESAYASNPSLDEVEQQAAVSKFALVRLFRRSFGITPHAFLVQVRVQRARALLASGAAPNQAALQVGFTDQSHFGRHFVRSMGVTPSVYARRVRAAVGARGRLARSSRASSSW
jgi:AraC-like DNA-binding protein